jgi:osmoprotectant transport system ATP-binding protein
VIRFDSVSKRYPGGTVAVDGLDLVAPSGQITVLVGPSGCGKTTSLRMINRMIAPTSGKIFIDDRDTGKGSTAKLRRNIGYVIQHAGLFPHRTVLDNVATVPFLIGVKKGTARTAAMELLERVGLPAEFADRYPAQLSGGQQQRVGVARALAANPPVMLMDEPFSAVDPVVRAQLQDEFLRLQAELGKTIVFVTHDIDEAIKMGDQVAVMRVGGKLAQLATPAELLSRPVDSFVAGFVGRDRGYRALGFAAAGALPLRQESPIGMGAELARAAAQAEDGWVLVVDNDARPQGWLAVDHANSRTAQGQVTAELLNLGGTLATESGTLREALDSALSSPSGRGVVVHPDGRFAGTITATQVLERIEEQAAANRNRAIQAAAARDRIEIPGEAPVFDQAVEEPQDTAVGARLEAIDALPDERSVEPVADPIADPPVAGDPA